MEVILHIGAHRMASTTFQHYMSENRAALRAAGIGVLGPKETRGGLLTGVLPVDSPRSPEAQLRRARARVAINLSKLEGSGVRHLVISDENVIGAARRNLRQGSIYPDIGQRMARFATVFEGRVSRISLSVRSQDAYLSSCFAFAVARGHRLPKTSTLDNLVANPRGWRDVITDLACAFPDVEIQVMPHEIFAGLPECRLQAMTGQTCLPKRYAREWMNRGPSLAQLRHILRNRGGDPDRLPAGEGRWQPFSQAQMMVLREAYADDLFWLRAGADGLATLIEETGMAQTGKNPAALQTQRGQDHGIEDRRMA
ncbi:hypothetical protein [Roseovarius aestuariivivens]|uniref:hypothetical protein n=1 Tax=Roseovarius aestuariivivens TaxID=1888910 RepID=UPI001080406A|nr:hypothetical protein [Roseovarius aestuariivivens]